MHQSLTKHPHPLFLRFGGGGGGVGGGKNEREELYFYENFQVRVVLWRMVGSAGKVLGFFYVKQVPAGAPPECPGSSNGVVPLCYAYYVNGGVGGGGGGGRDTFSRSFDCLFCLQVL